MAETSMEKLQELIDQSKRLADAHRSLIDPADDEYSSKCCKKAAYYDDVASALQELYFDKCK